MTTRFDEWLPWKGSWLSMAATPAEVRTREELARSPHQPSCASVWNELPAGVPPEHIGAVMLAARVEPDTLPSVLEELPALTTLSVPAALVSQIGPKVASRVRELVVVGTSAKLPDHPFPALRVLRCNDAELQFDPRRLPVLERLSLRKPSAAQQKAIASMSTLSGLRVGPIGQANMAWLVSMRQLESLTLVGGRVADLSPLAVCHGLRQVEFIALPALEDVAPLARLVQLDEVCFNQCSGVSKIEALLELPALRRVAFYASGKGRTYGKVLKTLAGRGVTIWPELD